MKSPITHNGWKTDVKELAYVLLAVFGVAVTVVLAYVVVNLVKGSY